MIHFLRTKRGNNIIETEVYGVIEDKTFNIESRLYPKGYAFILLEFHSDFAPYLSDFIKDISELDEINVYSIYLQCDKQIKTKQDVEDIVQNKYKKIAEKYSLEYVTD